MAKASIKSAKSIDGLYVPSVGESVLCTLRNRAGEVEKIHARIEELHLNTEPDPTVLVELFIDRNLSIPFLFLVPVNKISPEGRAS